jgi:hypothetical protein
MIEPKDQPAEPSQYWWTLEDEQQEEFDEYFAESTFSMPQKHEKLKAWQMLDTTPWWRWK